MGVSATAGRTSAAECPTPLPVDVRAPESFGYRIKRAVLGPPLISEQLDEQRLANPIAFGVLAPDMTSSSAYGTEEMLIELLPYAGLAAFWLVLPITGVILLILVLLVLSYRQVVMLYTKAGGSYVVARENFGPRVAQVAAVALLIDYVVTVAVQTAAGTVAVVSAIPALGPFHLEITVGVVLLICYGNLRGIREAGKAFAAPLYLFVALMLAMIVIGLIREAAGGLTTLPLAHTAGLIPVQQRPGGLVAGATLLVLLKSFANGGSSLTGFEAISNGVSAFRPPEGRNARKTLVAVAATLGVLVSGTSWLAHVTHAAPYQSGYPSVVSQEGRLVFGAGAVGHVLFYLLQAATALILYTGANTSFNGFPFLASFVAEDSFLPRQLTKRGHRLVFSNGIIVLTAVSLALLLVTDAKVNALVPFYAIGVFTGFSMAGYGMAAHFRRHRGRGYRYKIAVNLAAGIMSSIVVAIFAVVKFTEGAWLVVVLFPILVFVLIRLNREYREEAEALAAIDIATVAAEPNYPRHMVLVFVDQLDLATVSALRYGRSLHPTHLRAVHFVIDESHSHQLQTQWESSAQMIPLDLVDCPDRRLRSAAVELATRVTAEAGTHATVLLPRRTYSPLFGRILHDRTADEIAAGVSHVPDAAATIVPFDTGSRLSRGRSAARSLTAVPATVTDPPVREPVTGPRLTEPTGPRREKSNGRNGVLPEPAAGCQAIGALQPRERATVQGRIRSVEVQPLTSTSQLLSLELVDATGGITLLFYGRRRIAGIDPGRTVRATGRVGERDGHLAMANPTYQIVS